MRKTKKWRRMCVLLIVVVLLVVSSGFSSLATRAGQGTQTAVVSKQLIDTPINISAWEDGEPSEEGIEVLKTRAVGVTGDVVDAFLMGTEDIKSSQALINYNGKSSIHFILGDDNVFQIYLNRVYNIGGTYDNNCKVDASNLVSRMFISSEYSGSLDMGKGYSVLPRLAINHSYDYSNDKSSVTVVVPTYYSGGNTGYFEKNYENIFDILSSGGQIDTDYSIDVYECLLEIIGNDVNVNAPAKMFSSNDSIYDDDIELMNGDGSKVSNDTVPESVKNGIMIYYSPNDKHIHLKGVYQDKSGVKQELELDKLTSYLGNDNESELENYPVLRSIWSTYTKANSALEKKKSEEKQSSFIESLKDGVPDTSIGKWTYLMNTYKSKSNEISGGSSLNLEDYVTIVEETKDDDGNVISKFELKNDRGELYKLTDFPASGDELTEEEELRLRAYFYTLLNLSSDKLGDPYDPDDVMSATWKWSTIEGASESYPSVVISDTGYDPEYVEEAASSEIDLFSDYSGVAVNSVNSALMYCDSTAKYEAAVMYGFELQNVNLNGVAKESDGLYINQSPFLDSMLPSLNTSFEGNLLSFDYNEGLPIMKNMLVVDGSNQAYSAYLRLQYLIMLSQAYADDLFSNSDSNNNNNSTASKLADLIYNYNSNPDEVPEETLSPLATDIEKICSINDAFEYLGVDFFTTNLDKLSRLANVLEAFREFAGSVATTAYDDSEAMSDFFSLSSGSLSDDYKTGVELSATYTPMKTNMYELSSVAMVEDTNWVTRFHYPFGFYRKALYIDKNVNAAMDRYVTGEAPSDTRIATLQDLLEPEKDIVLYLDENFYNVDKLAEITGKVYTNIQNTEDSSKDEDADVGIFSAIKNYFDTAADMDIQSIVKTGGNSTYSRNVYNNVAKYNSGNDDKKTNLILDDESIDTYLRGYLDDDDDADAAVYDYYTPLQSYAVVSAVYRDTYLFNMLSSELKKSDPVFVSSPNLAGTTNITQEGFNTIYNYAMLKNLEASISIDVETTIDRNSPLYMDIYGNIITESGIVVIPAMSNATLCDPDSYSPATVGFVELYKNNVWHIPTTMKNADMVNSMFYVNDDDNTYELGSKRVNNAYINFNQLPTKDQNAVTAIKYIAQMNLRSNSYLPLSHRVYIITEVLRGAPLDSIDKTFEKISTSTTISKTGVYFAQKLDELSKMLLGTTSGNSLVELPNLAFMSGYEYVILFLYKIVFAACLALLFYRLYVDSVQGTLGFKSFASFILAIVMFLVIAFSIPTLLDVSYYQMNKMLLQDEVGYVAMLNYEKEKEGREIGITTVDAPETETELYLKIDDVSIPWYSIVDDVLFKSTFTTVSEIYADALSDSLLDDLPGVIQKGNGLYISVDYLFNTTDIGYDADTNLITNNVLETPYMSYVTPYYAILDVLRARINLYNQENSIKDYETKVMSQGSVETAGLITPYFTSTEFMDKSQDVIGLKYPEYVDSTLQEVSPFSQEDIQSMMYSYWYRTPEDDSDLWDELNAVDDYARMFVVDHSELLGKVSDETFLKVMALQIAVAYNDTVGISSANAIEIYDIDARDIIKLSLADKSVVLRDSSKSFSRFVYDNAGTLGVVMVAFLIVIYFLASFIKPVLIFIILGNMVASTVIRKTIKKDTPGAVEGLLITAAILAGTNMLYALLLKLSMNIPEFGVNMVVSCIVQILLQCIYLALLVLFTNIVLSDWKSMGFNKYMNYYNRMTGGIRYGTYSVRHARMRTRNVDVYGDRRYRRAANTGYYETGNDLLSQMRDRDIERRQHRGRR